MEEVLGIIIFKSILTTKSTKISQFKNWLDIANTNCILISGKLEKRIWKLRSFYLKSHFLKCVIVNTDAF